jgi:hypothetical protein
MLLLLRNPSGNADSANNLNVLTGTTEIVSVMNKITDVRHQGLLLGTSELDSVMSTGPVRTFDGVDDVIVLDEGTLDSAFNSAFTIAVLFKKVDETTDGFQFLASFNAGVNASQVGSVGITSGNAMQLSIGGLSVTFGSNFTITNGHWYLFVVRKASGTDTPDANLWDFDAASPAWVGWTNGTSTLDNSSSTVVEVRVGNGPGSFPFDGKLGGLAVWTSELSNVNAETLETSAQNWLDLDPAGMVLFTQTNVGDGVTDLTGNGMSQTAITGTTVDTTGGPAGFDFSVESVTNLADDADGQSPLPASQKVQSTISISNDVDALSPLSASTATRSGIGIASDVDGISPLADSTKLTSTVALATYETASILPASTLVNSSLAQNLQDHAKSQAFDLGTSKLESRIATASEADSLTPMAGVTSVNSIVAVNKTDDADSVGPLPGVSSTNTAKSIASDVDSATPFLSAVTVTSSLTSNLADDADGQAPLAGTSKVISEASKATAQRSVPLDFGTSPVTSRKDLATILNGASPLLSPVTTLQSSLAVSYNDIATGQSPSVAGSSTLSAIPLVSEVDSITGFLGTSSVTSSLNKESIVRVTGPIFDSNSLSYVLTMQTRAVLDTVLWGQTKLASDGLLGDMPPVPRISVISSSTSSGKEAVTQSTKSIEGTTAVSRVEA